MNIRYVWVQNQNLKSIRTESVKLVMVVFLTIKIGIVKQMAWGACTIWYGSDVGGNPIQELKKKTLCCVPSPQKISDP